MNLQGSYSREDFLEFIKTFIPGFKKDIRKFDPTSLKVSKEVFYLGESPDLDLAVFEITHSASSDARVSLATDGFRVMRDSANYRSLVAYRPENETEWRLSLMTGVPETTENGKVVTRYSNPRRYSFFLGEKARVNTPYRFLIKQGAVKDFEDLQKRFSLEVVNKEFYRQISESYTKLVGGILGTGKKEKKYKPILRLPSVKEHDQVTMEFGVRLIGRIIFCWFLREKRSDRGEPLMPQELLSLNALAHYNNYYHQILEPIFFEVLNKPVYSRREAFIDKPFSFIPYLNGGLFSPHEDDFYKRQNGD